MSEDLDTLQEFGQLLQQFERLNNTSASQFKLKSQMQFPMPEESFYIPAQSKPVQFRKDQDSSEEEYKN